MRGGTSFELGRRYLAMATQRVGGPSARARAPEDRSFARSRAPASSPILQTIALKALPAKGRSDKPQAVALPHALYSPEDGFEACLIVRDHAGEGHKAAKALLRARPIPGVAKVVGLSKLKTKYESYEAKRKLCASYDMFLADDRILPSLPKALGKSFFRKKKQPVPVRLSGSDWAPRVRAAFGSTFVHWSGGTSVTVRIARRSFDEDAIVENALATLRAALKRVPKGWKGVRAVYLKSLDSVALPVYQASFEEDKAFKIDLAGKASGDVVTRILDDDESEEDEEEAKPAPAKKRAPPAKAAVAKGKAAPAQRTPAKAAKGVKGAKVAKAKGKAAARA